jgi:predicted transcriptional regulator YdeE
MANHFIIIFINLNMNKVQIEDISLIGIALKGKTTNAEGQSGIDCGSLWQQFEKEGYQQKIPGKLSEEVFAVYHQYEGDSTQPFSYFIGCKVEQGTAVPEDLTGLKIPSGAYHQVRAKGIMPDCVADAWKEIWSSGISRKFDSDFEIYDERSKDWGNAEVDLYVSVR